MWERDEIKARHAKKFANYCCQSDGSHKTFLTNQNEEYVETHHIIPLSNQDEFDYSLDCYSNLLVLCPNCHRFFHYGQDYERREKLKMLYDERGERMEKAGILVDRDLFLDYALSK